MTIAWGRLAIVLLALAWSGCEQASLFAPTTATISVASQIRTLPPGGSAEVTAFVAQQGGAPVLNGTLVRFTASLGTVSPEAVETRNGVAVTRFTAGNAPGVAEVRATSGGTGTGTSSTATNVVQISIGDAAVNTVSLRAEPTSLAPAGGSTELVAVVVGATGGALEGVTVRFTTDQGTLSAPSAATNSNGEARTTLTTRQQAVVSATAGTKSSNNLTVAVRAGPIVSVSCAPAGGSPGCTTLQAGASTNSVTVVFTVSRASGSSALSSSTIDFGDGSTENLGSIASGTATTTHSYTGPSGTSPRSYTATARATDVNGDTASSSVGVVVAARTPLAVSLTASTGTSVAGVGNTTTFTATVTPSTGGADVVKSYKWDFDDDGDTDATTTSNTTTRNYTTNGRKTATVTVETTDGRSATGRVEFIISGI